MLGKAMVVIILQYTAVSNQHLYTLNLYNIIYLLHLNKSGKPKK